MNFCGPLVAGVDARAPLTRVDVNNRGHSKILCPKRHDRCDDKEHESDGWVEIFETRGDFCVNGWPLTIVLGVELEDNLKCFANDEFCWAAIQARVQWGLGSARFTAELDVLDGTQITVVGENVSVQARYVVASRPWEPDRCPVPPARISAGVGLGASHGVGSPARLTRLVQIEKPNDRQRIRVPRFATGLTVLPVQDSKVHVDVTALGRAYRVGYDVATPLSNAGQSNRMGALPLFNGAEFVDVTNVDSGAAEAFLVFELAL